MPYLWTARTSSKDAQLNHQGNNHSRYFSFSCNLLNNKENGASFSHICQQIRNDLERHKELCNFRPDAVAIREQQKQQDLKKKKEEMDTRLVQLQLQNLSLESRQAAVHEVCSSV